MNFEEFIRPQGNSEENTSEKTSALDTTTASEPEEADNSVELDVQKAVVESLAADKAEQDERISKLQKENDLLKSEKTVLVEKIEKLRAEVAKMGDALVANCETSLSNKVTLLERDIELSDNFEGETRDHVLEVIKEARDKAEQDGRLRRAQVLEAVLVANEPSGELAKRRDELNKLFIDNGNIVSGPVIDELINRNISHKNGENYLLPSEILSRAY